MERRAWVLLAVATAACSGKSVSNTITGTVDTAAEAARVGGPCSPTPLESSPSFAGYDAKEVNTVSGDPACGADICVVNHFQGLTTCPYGQTADGGPPGPGEPACTTPGTGEPVRPTSGGLGYAVPPQCLDRRAADVVYCSCRCANPVGATDDGDSYCACPGGYACTQLIAGIGVKDVPLPGAYCIKNGTQYDRASACAATCDVTLGDCP
jgi:hypothetical protein